MIAGAFPHRMGARRSGCHCVLRMGMRAERHGPSLWRRRWHLMVRVRLKAAALEVALASRNLTKTEFARLVGLHRTHLSDMLAGRTNPGPRTRQRLLDALNAGFDDLFEISGGEVRGP